MEDNILTNFDVPVNQGGIIKVIGVGGGGSNAVNHMCRKGIKDVDFMVCNTDSQALANSPVLSRVHLGASLTEGRGAGNKPEVGKRAAQENIEDVKNAIGEKTKAAGIQMVFHNHHMEFEKRGEELIYEEMMKVLNPDLVKMQFQVAVVNIGYTAADYFRKYPGRFQSAHLADWSKATDKQVPVGQGEVDWNDFFEAAKVGGVQNFFVEMDPDAFKPSAAFLLNLS